MQVIDVHSRGAPKVIADLKLPLPQPQLLRLSENLFSIEMVMSILVQQMDLQSSILLMFQIQKLRLLWQLQLLYQRYMLE
jgi:hypothetical protein